MFKAAWVGFSHHLIGGAAGGKGGGHVCSPEN